MSWPDLPGEVAHTSAGVAEGLARDLVRDAASSTASAYARGEFEADLVVLHGYYRRLEHLYEQVTGHVAAAAGAVTAAEVAAGVVAGGGAGIAGLAAASRATFDAAAGTGMASLHRALLAVQADLSSHLDKLHDTYTSYIEVDERGARTLTAAADPDAITSLPRDGSTGKASGW